MPISTERFEEARRLVSTWRRPLIITHSKPDGDAIGSLVAMRRFLGNLGIQARDVVFDVLPERYTFVSRLGAPDVYGRDVAESDLPRFDSLIVVDTCTFNQLEPLAEWLRTAPVPRLVVDHHQTRDDLGAFELVDERAAATCQILLDWAKAVGWAVDPTTATALFVGLSTDTGWFRHANTNSRALRAAADLLDAGAETQFVYRSIYQQDSPGRLRLLAAALQSLELHFNGQLAVQCLSEADFERSSALISDTEDLVNEPLRIDSVVVSVLLVEQEPRLTRVNFRSKQPVDPQGLEIDVSELAAGFGGGGHRRAAGARVKQSLTEVRQVVLEAVRPGLAG